MIRTVDVVKSELDCRNQELQLARDALQCIANQVHELEVELRSACDHPQSALKNESKHYPGTYYDKASTTHWTTCTICGSKSESWEETHSYYG